MVLVYVEDAKLYVAVMDGKVLQIQKGKTRSVNPCAVLVTTLDATFNAIHVADGRLYLDGLGLIELAGWLQGQMPDTTFRTFARRLLRHFPGSAFISDLLRATVRCVAGLEDMAQGEDALFCRMVREAHPVEIAELRAALTEPR